MAVPYKTVVISDFNAENLLAYMRNDARPPIFLPVLENFETALMRGGSEDVAIVWTRPEGVIPSFKKLLDSGSHQGWEKEVDRFASFTLGLSEKIKYVLVASWTLAPYENAFPSLGMRANGISRLLMEMNLRLSKHFDAVSNVVFLDAGSWLQSVPAAYNPKLWYMAKIPFSQLVFFEAHRRFKAALSGLMGDSKKLLLLDLDDTLWGGLVGEEGWEKLKLGGHDALGEAYVDFQRALLSLKNRGVLLGIASKNEEAAAVEALIRHPEMVLKPDDFAARRINWKEKAQNILEMVQELKLGLDSVVFIDDSAVERSRVRAALPEVEVPEWPEDPLLFRKALLELGLFDRPALSETDLKRTELYQTEKRRTELQKAAISFEDWLIDLQVQVMAEALTLANLPRAAQLLNKTNQMNLSTRRLSETELWEWANAPGRKLFTFKVIDKLGDSGLTGLASIIKEGNAARIVDFVLSCRVIGRKVEETMLHALVEEVRAWRVHEVFAEYVPTPRNAPCLEFWLKSGFVVNGGKSFHHMTTHAYPLPREINFKKV